MKYSIIAAILLSGSVQASTTETVYNTGPVCSVRVCNKLERVTLSLSSMFKDKLGETCFDAVLPKSEAVEGKTLSSDSRWYQGSFNPTKKSVTRVNKVYECVDTKNTMQ